MQNLIAQLIKLLISSLIATLLPLPVNAIDITIVATTHKHFITNIIFAPIFDALWAVPTYYLAHQLNRLFKKKLPRINRGTDIALFVASATPAPFTLTIYAIGIIGYKRSMWRFMGVILIGRIIKYTFLSGVVLLGINIQISPQVWITIILAVVNILFMYYNYIISNKSQEVYK